MRTSLQHGDGHATDRALHHPAGMTGDASWLGGNWAPFIWAAGLTLVQSVLDLADWT